MAVREYVGARYVPLFADPIQWSNQNTYEPLTIVVNQGASYTSRQFVPVGIDIANTDYWALTGNYNAQIEQYRNEVNQLKNEIKEYVKVYDTVEAMSNDVDIEPNCIYQTMGFHSKGDNGGAYYITSSEGSPNGMDIIQCNGVIATLIITTPYVTPEMFGAYGNGINDDIDYINRAISVINGSVVFSNKNYAISDSILLKRGIKLTSNCTYDNMSNNGAVIYMMNGMNKSAIITPSVDTHYVVIENLAFNGNQSGQSIETNVLDIRNLFIGSSIRNVFVYNFYGTALHIQNSDIDINNIWLSSGVTLTNRYAFDTNQDLSEDGRSNMINFNHVYVENYSNKFNGQPRTTAEDRAKTVRFNKCNLITGRELSIEGSYVPVTIFNTYTVNIDTIRGTWIGNSSNFIEVDGGYRGLKFTNLTMPSGSTDIQYWVKYIGTSTNNTLVNLEYENISNTVNEYSAIPFNNSTKSVMNSTIFSNTAAVKKVGNTVASSFQYLFDSGTSNLYHTTDVFKFMSSLKNTEGEMTEYFGVNIYGNDADSVAMYQPLYLGVRTNNGYVSKGCIYMINNSPTFQRGSNDSNIISTIKRGSGAPTIDSLYLCEMYFDYTNKKLYISTGTGSGASDWTALN